MVKDSVTTAPVGTVAAVAMAAGMETVTFVLGGKPVAGVKSATSPSTSHVPGMAGEIRGSGGLGGNGLL